MPLETAGSPTTNSQNNQKPLQSDSDQIFPTPHSFEEVSNFFDTHMGDKDKHGRGLVEMRFYFFGAFAQKFEWFIGRFPHF